MFFTKSTPHLSYLLEHRPKIIFKYHKFLSLEGNQKNSRGGWQPYLRMPTTIVGRLTKFFNSIFLKRPKINNIDRPRQCKFPT